MAKSNNKKSSKGTGKGSSKPKALTAAQRGAITRKANQEAKAAEQAYQKERRRISNAISYRNRKLKTSATIFKEDEPTRNRYLRELRKLYKEQNPKKNKSLTPKEKEHYTDFRDLARMQLKMLTSITDKEVESWDKKKRKQHVADVKYYKGVVDKITSKVFKDKAEPIDYTKIDFNPPEEREGEELGIDQEAEVLESEMMMLSFQAQIANSRLVSNPFFRLLIMQINGEEHSSLKLDAKTRLTAAIEFQQYTGYIRHHFCEGGTVRYDYEVYSNGVIVFDGYCSKNGKRL